MNIWEKFDKAIDTEALAKDVESAAEGKIEYKEVPKGQYEVKITKMELVESKKGSPMLSVWMKILSGDYENSLIFYNQVLSTGFGIHNANEFMRSLDCGIESIEFKNFKQYNDLIMDVFEAVDDKLEFGLEYGENNKGYKTYKITDIFEV